MAKKKLTDKELIFVSEFLVGFNQREAAKVAGYKNPDGSGHMVRNRPHVKEEIDRRIKAMMHRNEVKRDDIIEELRKIAFSDIRGCLTENMELKPPKDWPDDFAKSVQSFEVVKGRVGTTPSGKPKIGNVLKVRMHQKLDAIDKLSRIMGLYNDEKDGADELVAALKTFAQGAPGA